MYLKREELRQPIQPEKINGIQAYLTTQRHVIRRRCIFSCSVHFTIPLFIRVLLQNTKSSIYVFINIQLTKCY